MSKKVMRTYTEEYKQEAVRLALQSPSVDAVAKNLGIPGATLHTWLSKANSRQRIDDKGDGKAVDVAALIEENRRLHKKLQQTEEKREILKKAAADSIDHCNSWFSLSKGVLKPNVFLGR